MQRQLKNKKTEQNIKYNQ